MTEQQPELDPDGPSTEDLTLGVPGPAEPLPEGDADRDDGSEGGVNDYDDEDDD